VLVDLSGEILAAPVDLSVDDLAALVDLSEAAGAGALGGAPPACWAEQITEGRS